jgi:type 2 lantibiotic biosynthesis protein LanM
VFSREEIEKLALRAATLDERLSDDYVACLQSPEDSVLAAKRLAAWCHAASSGDRRLFSKRLSRDGFSLNQASQKLGGLRRAEGNRFTLWVEDATWITSALAKVSAPPVGRIVETQGSQPFRDLFFTVIDEAQARRDAELPSGACDRFHADVHRLLADDLLSRLSDLCSLALYDVFSTRRKLWRGMGFTAQPTEYGSRAKDVLYIQFLNEMRQSGWREVFDAKPVLLRLVASLTRQWIDATREFIERWNADRKEAIDLFFDGEDPRTVCALKTGLSDLHKSGRSVYVLHFENGRSLVYKPKSLGVDRAWALLIDWLNRRSPPIDLHAARVLDCGDYGWAEYVEYGGIADRLAASRFFCRAGAFLCLFHLMAGTDMHEENLIAAGEHPVPIDLETLLIAYDASRATGVPALQAIGELERRLSDSVIITGLLPAFVCEPDTAVVTTGGFVEARGEPTTEIGWLDCNNDTMRPAEKSKPRETGSNLPHLDGAKIQIVEYRNEFLEAARDYFEFIVQLKRELLASGGPLDGFAHVLVRRVFRPTRFYSLLLRRLRDHRTMHDGAIWSANLDFISRLADWTKEAEPLWALSRAERQALAALNIPFFVHAADGTNLGDGDGILVAETPFASGFAEAVRRSAELDREQIERQIHIADLSLLASIADARPSGGSDAFTEVQADNGTRLDASEALAHAGRIAQTLAACALRKGKGAAWMGLYPMSDGRGWTYSALGHDLYGGASGIALFLAAHASVSGFASSRALALEGLAATRHIVGSEGAGHFARITGIGGGSGLGGLIYAFSSIAELVGEPSLIDDAGKVARLITDDLIAADKLNDVIGGAAGAVLGLLKLYKLTGDDLVLPRAIACGRHLVTAFSKNDPGNSLPASVGRRPPLTGFSHGAAGFSYAFAALAEASGEKTFHDMATKCLAYERGLYSSEHENWPDLRDAEPAWSCQWCHGAGGIGLARIGMLHCSFCDSEIHRDIKRAVSAVRRYGHSSNDTLCCGNMGNVQMLLDAARELDEPSLATLAMSRMAQVTETASNRGQYGWRAGSDNENPGLFLGLSGVGYSLLRMIAPEKVPNVLLWA